MNAFSGIKQVYENSPLESYKRSQFYRKDLARNILGGEALVWGNNNQGESVGSQLWPRGIALAERLWSNSPSGTINLK